MINEEEGMPIKLLKSLNDIITNENFTERTIESRVVPPDGGSFMGILREITIKGKKDKKDQEIELFVKSMKPDSKLNIYSVPGAYAKETKIYCEIFQIFQELQDEANVPFEERFYMPKTYPGINSEHIIMENLAKKGYTMCERLKVFPLKFAQLTVQQLAKFHGMAFVLEAKRPEFFEAEVKTLKQPFYYNTTHWDSFVGNVSRASLTILDPESRKKVEAYLPTTFAKYDKYAQESPVKTFVHGDFRANNIMSKINDEEITEVILIDYQQSFYGCSIIDFLYFIFSGSDQEFREKHLEDLKNLYYDSMRQFLKCFDLDIDLYYPKETFEKIYKERLDYGLMISLWLVPIILADKGEVPDVTTVDLNEFNFKFNDTVKSRVRGAVDEFIKWGYL